MKTRLLSIVALLVLAGILPSQAGIFTFPDFVRTAGGGALQTNIDFVTNDGWSGTPPNTTAGDDSLFLTATVSWVASSSFGTFNVRFNQNDDGGAPRIGMGTDGTGFGLLTGNAVNDPDGAGPATAKPVVVAVDKTTTTSVTLVMKVNHTLGGTTPGGDWWFRDAGLQSGALAFMWIDPNLGATEGSQFTPWAAWRSGNSSYQGVSFISNATVDLTFSNIAIYTGADTPFSTAVGGVDAVTSTVSASPATVLADGSTTSTITVTLKDADSVPVAGKIVSLVGDTGNAIIATSNNTSSSSGVVNFTVKSSTIGTETFTATGDSVTLTQTASVNFQSPLTDAANSTVVATPTTVLADGAAFSTITVTLKNSGGLPLAGKVVSLAKTSGPGSPVIDPATATTDSLGVATFTVRSTTQGTDVFTATDTTGSVVITQTASVVFSDNSVPLAFNVSFVQFTPTLGNFEDPALFVGPAGGSGETWNQIRAASGSNLLVSSGVATAVAVTTNFSECRERSTSGLTLLNDALTDFGRDASRTVTISGLPPGSLYSVWLASTANFGGTESANGTFSTTNATSTAGGQTINQTVSANTTSWEQGNNYVLFENVVVDGSGNIILTAASATGYRLPLSGFQLVPAGKARIISFEAAGNPGVIDQAAFTINVTVPFGTNLATLAPTFTLNSGACNQPNAAPPSPTFAASNPVHYVVTDTTTDPDTVNDYAVTVTVAPQLATLVINLGTSPSGTVIEGGTFGTYGATNLPLPPFPAGSILKSIQVNTLLEATDNLNFASDLAVLLDPTPGTPGGDFSVIMTNGSLDFSAALKLGWPPASNGDVGTPLTDTKTDADWAAAGVIDLNTTGLFLGNSYGGPTVGGTWSGTITLTYIVPATSSTYSTWSGGEAFDSDKNGDGVKNGLAFLLGAANPDANATGLLPTVSKNAGGLIMTFNCLNSASRGGAVLNLEHSGDLGILDAWARANVPEANGTVNGVSFAITPGSPLNGVVATIPSSEAVSGKLFGRLSGSGN